MIEFLNKKNICFNNIKDILSKSNSVNHYTNDGPVKRDLEKLLEEKLSISTGSRVLCCVNGTAAIHSILYLCKYKYNIKNWVTPAFTFPSCVVGHGLDVDILDIDKHTYTLPLDKNKLAKYQGIILTNLFGSCVDFDAWIKFCYDNNKVLVFDNAASPLSCYNGVNICNFGDYIFGSLHHTKYFGFGEGGFIVLPETDYNLLSSITNFGFYGNRIYKKFSSNFKITDVSAAFIIEHINNYDVQQHLYNQNILLNNINSMQNVKCFNYKSGNVYNTFPVVYDNIVTEDDLDNDHVKLHKYYQPLLPLQNSLDLYEKIVNFPLYASLTKSDLNIITTIISSLIK